MQWSAPAEQPQDAQPFDAIEVYFPATDEYPEESWNVQHVCWDDLKRKLSGDKKANNSAKTSGAKSSSTETFSGSAATVKINPTTQKGKELIILRVLQEGGAWSQKCQYAVQSKGKTMEWGLKLMRTLAKLCAEGQTAVPDLYTERDRLLKQMEEKLGHFVSGVF